MNNNNNNNEKTHLGSFDEILLVGTRWGVHLSSTEGGEARIYLFFERYIVRLW